MRKVLIVSAAMLVGVASPVFAATGTTGSTGTAGLGSDFAASITVSAGANPSISVPPPGTAPGMGGPIAGILNKFRNR